MSKISFAYDFAPGCESFGDFLKRKALEIRALGEESNRRELSGDDSHLYFDSPEGKDFGKDLGMEVDD